MRLAAVILTVFAALVSFGSGASGQETFYAPRTLSHRQRVMAQAALVGQLAENHRRNQELRAIKRQAYLDTLYEVERASIPVPDNPPIRYPDAAAWRELTARRAAEPLYTTTAGEARIEAALRQPTRLEFIGTSLGAVIDYLKDLHGIEIQIDHWGLAQAGLGPDTPVTQNVRGISLRSALRLMLGQMGLTYVVRDDVLLITTRDRADTMLKTRIYRNPRPTTVHIQSTVIAPW